jgi:hypothetical protein
MPTVATYVTLLTTALAVRRHYYDDEVVFRERLCIGITIHS